MTRHSKLVLSVAAIAILNSPNALAVDISGEGNFTNNSGVATYPGSGTAASAIEIKKDLTKDGLKNDKQDDITELKITAPNSALTLDASTQKASIGGNNSANYKLDITAKTVDLQGGSGRNDTASLEIQADSTIKADKVTLNDSNSLINFASGKTLTITGALDAQKGLVDLGGGTLSVSNGLTASKGTLDVADGGTIKLTGGTSSITGEFATTADKAMTFEVGNATLNFDKLDIKKSSILKFGDAAAVVNITNGITFTASASLDLAAGGTLTLGGTSSLAEVKTTEDKATNINLADSSAKATFKKLELEKSGKFTLNGGSATFTEGLVAEKDKGTLDLSNGGALTFNGDKTSLGDIDLTSAKAATTFTVVSASASASATFNSLKLGESKINLGGTKSEVIFSEASDAGTGTIDLNGGTLTASKGITADKATLTLSEGGTINLGAGKSSFGDITTTEQKDTKFVISSGGDVSFNKLTLTDSKGILTLGGGKATVTNGLTTTAKESLDLAGGGTLTLGGTSTIKGDLETTQGKSLTLSLVDANSNATFDKLTLKNTSSSHDKIVLNGGTATFTNGLLGDSNAKIAADSLDLTKGGTLAVGGTENKFGEIATTAAQNTTFKIISGGAAEFDSLTLTDAKSVLSLGDKNAKFTGKLVSTNGTLDIANGGQLTLLDGSSLGDIATAADKETKFTISAGKTATFKSLNLADAKSTLSFGDKDSTAKITNGLTTTDKASLVLTDGGKFELGGASSIGGEFKTENSKAVEISLTHTTDNPASLTFKEAVKLTNDTDKLTLGGGTVSFEKGVSKSDTEAVGDSVFVLTDGGTLNFGGDSKLGKISSANGKALNLNLADAKSTVSATEINLKNKTSGTAVDTLALNGGTLNVGKLTADGANLAALGDSGATGKIVITASGSVISGDLNLTKADTVIQLESAGEANIAKLDAKSSNIDLSKGGKLTLTDDSSISGDLALKAGTLIAPATDKTLNLDTANLTENGALQLAGGTVNIANGLNAANASENANLKISAGGTINLNGGTSTLGKVKTENAKTDINVADGATLNLGDLTLAEDKGAISMLGENATINLNGATNDIAKAANLGLTKGGTLNFNSKDNDGKTASTTTIKDDLDISKITANFNAASTVKIGDDGKKKLTAAELNLNGGEIQLGELSTSTTNGNSIALNFAGAKATLSGTKSGTAGTLADSTNGFKINANGIDGQDLKIGQNSDLSIDSGDFVVTNKLSTQADGTLTLNGGNLSVGNDSTKGEVVVAKAEQLKFAQDAVINIGKNSSKLSVEADDLNISKATINIADTGTLALASAGAKLIGEGNTINLATSTDGKTSAITIDGTLGGVKNVNAKAAGNEIEGDLTLDGDNTLTFSGENTTQISKLTVEENTATKSKTATLAFADAGSSVDLLGGTEGSTNAKFSGSGVSTLNLSANSVLNFNNGTVKMSDELKANGNSKVYITNGATADISKFTTDNVDIEVDNGTLNVGSDFEVKKDLALVQNSASSVSPAVNVTGTATIDSGAKVAIVVAQGVTETTQTSYDIIKASGVVTNNGTAEARVRRNLSSIASDISTKYGVTDIDLTSIKITDADKYVDAVLSDKKFELKTDNNTLTMKGDTPIIDASTLQSAKTDDLAVAIAALKAINTSSNNAVSAVDDGIKAAIAKLEAQKAVVDTQSNSQIAQETAKNAGENASDILLSAYGSGGSDTGASNSAAKTAIYNDIVYNGGQGVVKDIKDGASGMSQASSASSSILNFVNLSNNMAIYGRIANANNPYGNLARGFAGQSYAVLEGDMPLYYANTGYDNGVWANLIGGANIIDGETGGVYGLSVGYDRQFERTLLGFYLTYAGGEINDKVVEQDSQNVQVGAYLSFNQSDIEVNLKAYGQASMTDMNSKRTGGDVSADFTRLFAGLNANIGWIFALNENKTFLKPYIGENYYYTYTPAYDEKGGVSALSVNALNNHALAIELGLDVRHYLGENSYFFATPSIERYVVNSGGDYTAGFVGSGTTFTIEGQSKTKTYGQLLVGGNINFSENLNMNISFGAKQIFDGKYDGKNETYLTGNVGVKYKF